MSDAKQRKDHSAELKTKVDLEALREIKTIKKYDRFNQSEKIDDSRTYRSC